MRPVTVLAHNPGPYTGAGTNTYFLPGQVPVLIDAGTGDPRHLDGVGDALSGAGVAAKMASSSPALTSPAGAP